MITLQLQVWGLVQGVGFRYFTKIAADKAHIHGSVQNKIDGSVLIIIQATPEDAYKFADALQETPPSPYAKIRKAELTIVDTDHEYTDFQII